MKKTEQCFCQSYYEDNVLKDCTCGKCDKTKERKTNWKEKHYFEQDNNDTLCVCGLPIDSPLHLDEVKTIQTIVEEFKKKFPVKTVSYPGCLTLTNALDRQRRDEMADRLTKALSQTKKDTRREVVEEIMKKLSFELCDALWEAIKEVLNDTNK